MSVSDDVADNLFLVVVVVVGLGADDILDIAEAGLLFIMKSKWLEVASGARLTAELGLCLKRSLMLAWYPPA